MVLESAFFRSAYLLKAELLENWEGVVECGRDS